MTTETKLADLCLFARRINPQSEQFAGVVPAGMLGNDEPQLLVFNPQSADINVALFRFKDGDRDGSPLAKVRWRLNRAPVNQAPSVWVDLPQGGLAGWYHHDGEYYSFKRAEGSLASVREYQF
jgi:hypothetical protein